MRSCLLNKKHVLKKEVLEFFFFLDFGLVLAIFPTKELDQWRGYWSSYALHRYRIFRVLVAGISL